MMNRIIRRVERDPLYRRIMNAQHPEPEATAPDAISAAAAQVAHTLSAAAIVTYTTSGSTALRAARERPEVPILCLTSKIETARRLAVVWGIHCVNTRDVDTSPRWSTRPAASPARGDRQIRPAPGDHRRRALRHARRHQRAARRLGARLGRALARRYCSLTGVVGAQGHGRRIGAALRHPFRAQQALVIHRRRDPAPGELIGKIVDLRIGRRRGRTRNRG